VDGPAQAGGEGTTTGMTAPDLTSSSTSGPSPTTIDPFDTTSGDSGSSSSDELGNFIQKPDGVVCGPPPPEGTLHHCSWCDPWSQDCPAGHKCNPWANDGTEQWNAVLCTDVDPDAGGPGDPCTVEASGWSGRDSCRVGSMCWNVDPDTLDGECVGFCEGSENDAICPVQTDCMIANDGVLVLCLPTCDPLADEACDDGQSCRLIRETWFCVPDGAGVYDGPLTPTLCEPGSTAVDPLLLSTCDPKDDLCCAQICDVTAAACEEPLQCVAAGDTGNAGLCLD
jgi:hypothetical protein